MAKVRPRRQGRIVSRYDFRWMTRHPFRWLSYWWPVLALAAALYAIAIAWTDPTFSIIRFDPAWPIALATVATLIVAAVTAPFHHGLRVLAGAALITAGVFRVILYIDVLLLESLPSAQAMQLSVQIGHWIIVVLIGVALPTLIGDIGLRATLEAGRDDRTNGDGKADGGGAQ